MKIHYSNLFESLTLATFFLGSVPAFACLDAPFTAMNSYNKPVAKIMGNQILDFGWHMVRTRNKIPNYKTTVFRNDRINVNNRELYLHEATNPAVQPEIVWGVYRNVDVMDSTGFENFYDIRTDTRSLGRQTRLTKDPRTGHWQVSCR